MSYIINSTSPFVSIKLTEKGRELLAQGQLNFSFWGIGDSELNYDREAIVDANPTDIILSRWLDPKIKGYDGMQDPEAKLPDDESAIILYQPLSLEANEKYTREFAEKEALKRNYQRDHRKVERTSTGG